MSLRDHNPTREQGIEQLPLNPRSVYDIVATQRVWCGAEDDDLMKDKAGERSSGDVWLFLDEQLAMADGAAESQ